MFKNFFITIDNGHGWGKGFISGEYPHYFKKKLEMKFPSILKRPITTNVTEKIISRKNKTKRFDRFQQTVISPARSMNDEYFLKMGPLILVLRHLSNGR